MKEFFSTDGKLYKFMTRLTDMLKLNLMLMIFMVPFMITYVIAFPWFVTLAAMLLLIPMGASLTAGYTITLKMVSDEEGYIVGPFLKEFKANFKKGCVLGVLLLATSYAMWIDFQLYQKAKSGNTVFLVVFIIGVVLIVTHFLYAFPLLARYENTVYNTLHNSHSIAVRFFPRTFFTCLLVALEVVFFIFNNVTLFLGILIGLASILLTISANIRPIFAKIEDETAPDDESDENIVESEALNDSND